MIGLIVFGLISLVLIYISRRSLFVPQSHGFYRFFAWEFIAALLALNLLVWFRNPWS